jgi:hypothetical protein
LRIYDGDTSPGYFDYNDLYLALDGISTGIPLNGFSNNLDVTLSIGGTPGNAAAILSSLHSDGLLVATIIDNDYSDNITTLPSGFNASLVLGGAAAPTLALAADTGSSNSDGITNNGTVNLTGLETGATWQYSTNGGSSWTNGTGTSFVLSSGTYSAGSVLVRQSDIAGNTSANGQLSAVTIDTSAAAPSLALASDTGVSNSDGNSSSGTVNVSGLETGASWQYSVNGGISWLAGTGNSFSVAPGTYGADSILVRQSDIAGNTSANGQLGSVTIDTSAPSGSVGSYATAPAYAAPSTNPFGITNSGNYASPSFADIDNDGDLDYIIGNGAGQVGIFTNTASVGSTSPAYTLSAIPFDVGDLASPAFADIDLDGDLDLFVGNNADNILYYRNTAILGASAPSTRGRSPIRST